MSASRPHAPNLRGDSVLPAWVKEGGRAILAPVVRLAIALHLTPNTITVIGLGITIVAASAIGAGWLLAGAIILTAGSLLDAVDGALARATGGGTAFGSFLDSTLDRAGEAILYIGIGAWLVTSQPEPVWPIVALLVALSGSFLVSYAHARAQGIGLAADVGLAPRTERLVIVIAGVALAGLGFTLGLLAALVVLAVLTTATVIQRIWHVWRLSRTATHANKEN
ncbi:MAG TPA: CDP-alcohol phosphatidyltransferase family protein [Candidatus Angelobacter sp.]|nr:CDP-alcohol phosphatidyltransferase family protein [Candidatus Angelobacter sp.]